MSNETLTPSSFPSTQRDISLLKQTATDAVNDLSSTAAVHATKAKSNLKDLAGHFQEEGGAQLDQVKGKLSDLVFAARDFASDRPFACIGVALVLGFFIGAIRRSGDQD